ncbi:Hypothetical predicted protein [Mytilus galloprovincialis]|uniref:Uncharacterized protein n=1 Tax=Mytilus galloprovincialis TaxID=29158 RepID=A0A8B6HD88_MYTGA|nr:Hypothetical predicted protein [Mytilus galloprovincialis]
MVETMLNNGQKPLKPGKTPFNYHQEIQCKIESAFDNLDLFTQQPDNVVSFKSDHPPSYPVDDCDNDTTIPYLPISATASTTTPIVSTVTASTSTIGSSTTVPVTTAAGTVAGVTAAVSTTLIATASTTTPIASTVTAFTATIGSPTTFPVTTAVTILKIRKLGYRILINIVDFMICQRKREQIHFLFI